MKVSRQVILATLLLGSIAGTVSAMFPGYNNQRQYSQFNNMGNMFGQQPYMRMPQQSMFGQMPQMRQPNPMMYAMRNQFSNNTGQNAEQYALAGLMNWMMTGKQHYLQSAVGQAIQIFANKYYPQKLKNIWWTRVIIDTALARLSTVGVTKALAWFNGQKAAQGTE